MAEETPATQSTPKGEKTAKTPAPKKKGGWFRKIPTDVIFWPA